MNHLAASAFDQSPESAEPAVDALPGGLEAGIEAVLMVIDEPLAAGHLAQVL